MSWIPRVRPELVLPLGRSAGVQVEPDVDRNSFVQAYTLHIPHVPFTCHLAGGPLIYPLHPSPASERRYQRAKTSKENRLLVKTP